jgi:hypothetical protein
MQYCDICDRGAYSVGNWDRRVGDSSTTSCSTIKLKRMQMQKENGGRGGAFISLALDPCHKRRINESGDYAGKNVEEEPRKMRKCRHLSIREEPIVLELIGEEICLRTGHVKSSHSR